MTLKVVGQKKTDIKIEIHISGKECSHLAAFLGVLGAELEERGVEVVLLPLSLLVVRPVLLTVLHVLILRLLKQQHSTTCLSEPLYCTVICHERSYLKLL